MMTMNETGGGSDEESINLLTKADRLVNTVAASFALVGVAHPACNKWRSDIQPEQSISQQFYSICDFACVRASIVCGCRWRRIE